MSRMRQTMIALVAAALLAAPATAQGGQGGERPRRAEGVRAGPGAPARNPVAMLLDRREELELTAEQVARLEAVRERVERENAPRIERLRAALGDRPRRELSDEERARLRGRMQELQPVRDEIRATNRAAMEEAREVLTDEQESKLREIVRRPRGERPAGRRPALSSPHASASALRKSHQETSDPRPIHRTPHRTVGIPVSSASMWASESRWGRSRTSLLMSSSA